jgi:hypothetical protein
MTWAKRPPSPAKRLRRRDQEVNDLMARGEYRFAFNHAAGAVQAALARVFREHPARGNDHYAYYARLLMDMAAEIQKGQQITDADLRRVGLSRGTPPPRAVPERTAR